MKQAAAERLWDSAIAPNASPRAHWAQRRCSSSGVQSAPEPADGRLGETAPLIVLGELGIGAAEAVAR